MDLIPAGQRMSRFQEDFFFPAFVLTKIKNHIRGHEETERKEMSQKLILLSVSALQWGKKVLHMT